VDTVLLTAVGKLSVHAIPRESEFKLHPNDPGEKFFLRASGFRWYILLSSLNAGTELQRNKRDNCPP